MSGLQAVVQLVQQWLSLNSPQNWMSQVVLSACWNPKAVGSNASEGIPQQHDI